MDSATAPRDIISLVLQAFDSSLKVTRMTHHQSFRVPVHSLFYRGSDVRIVLGLGNDLRYQNDPIGLFMYFAVHHKKIFASALVYNEFKLTSIYFD